MTDPTSIPAASQILANSTLAGRSLRDLCRQYTKDMRVVVEALIQAGDAGTLLLAEPRAAALADLWQAEAAKQTAAQRALAERRCST
jgi:hypothetical protein